MYQLFSEGANPPPLPNLPKRLTGDMIALGVKRKDAPIASKFLRLLGRIPESDRGLLVFMARKMARSAR